MNLVSLTFWAVSFDFFRNVHVIHYQLRNKGTYAFLYFFTFKPKMWVFWFGCLLKEKKSHGLRRISCDFMKQAVCGLGCFFDSAKEAVCPQMSQCNFVTFPC